MIYVLYNTLLWLAMPFIMGWHWYRAKSRGRPAAFAERFGRISGALSSPASDDGVIWVHAVSVGETIAVTPLLKALKQRWPQRKIILSNTTETGREVAAKLDEIDGRVYFPFDYGFAAEGMLRQIRPSLVIVVETEIWPNFLRGARRLGIPLVMVNGRISDRSFPRYRRLSWFFRPVLRNFSALCMQSEEDARRIKEIGADSDSVHVTGNLKFDVPLGRLDEDERRALRATYRLDGAMHVFTAGSTHPGEDEPVIEAFLARSHEADAVMVLVPRHPERAPAVANLLRDRGLSFVLRSELDSCSGNLPAGGVLLVDTVGELKLIYSLSDVVFVGGSLVPTGGHNVLEPASFGVPVIFGPHMSNFREISKALLTSGGGIQVEDGSALTEELHRLLASKDDRNEIGSKGMNWLRGNSGSVERHIGVISREAGRH